ncbi:hypothetical protein KIH74_11275 [Kineosporia sp. J2-2]|uniref:Carrier domain-containing protein n=1 Tax=Kineosporia corallincola TaxID=2835133 RepID=A0ABS5TEI5_9ACTN|nr:phosphopantetheine-binding protein [Kineosporia corallincola]MBT0769505.1 hypothetical protein [Kineosporia corallincola]
MTATTFALPDLMNLLARVGLPAAERTDDPSLTLTDIGLDSLAFLQLQTLLQQQHGVSIDESEEAADYPLGRLVELVNSSAEQEVSQP